VQANCPEDTVQPVLFAAVLEGAAVVEEFVDCGELSKPRRKFR